MNSNNSFQVLLAFPFRPFFLLTAMYAVLTVVAWIGQLFAGWPLPIGWSAVHWHSHEMLFGLVTAAIAGFVLTAVCNWTGAPPLRNRRLLALVGLWFAGRVAMWTGDWWPAELVTLIDILFLPAVSIYLLRVLSRHANTRNYILAGIIGSLGFSNLWMHMGFIKQNIVWVQHAEVTALNIMTLIMIVVAGRITPAFTENWLRFQGQTVHNLRAPARFDQTVLIVTALMIPSDWISNAPWLGGIVALAAALLSGIRLWHWSGWRAAREPLLWILHVGYGWIVVALLLKGLAAFEFVPASAWKHALGVGAMATLILGVMTRVALGHTGRQLRLPRFATTIYLAILVTAISRVSTALLWIDYQTGLLLSAVGWVLAFFLFLVFYWPVLSRPRVDGRPG